MHCTFKTFHVGAGDCITLLLQNDNKEIHILVDCGKFTSAGTYYVCQKFGERIDYLIVTHFDNDHINGIIAMLRVMPRSSSTIRDSVLRFQYSVLQESYYIKRSSAHILPKAISLLFAYLTFDLLHFDCKTPPIACY